MKDSISCVGMLPAQHNENFSISCQNKQLAERQDTDNHLYDPSELFDFLSSDTSGDTNGEKEMNISDLDCLNNLDFDFSFRGRQMI